MISLQGVAKKFHSAGWPWRVKRPPVEAVRDLSFRADDGAITGLLGPNGAGKTTTLRMLAGLMIPDAGILEVDGHNVQSSPQKALARLGVLSDVEVSEALLWGVRFDSCSLAKCVHLSFNEVVWCNSSSASNGAECFVEGL